MRRFSETEQETLDANTHAVSHPLDIRENKLIAFTAIHESGTHGTHVITLQHSVGGSNWRNTSHTLQGIGVVDNIATAAKQVRLKVTTVQGGPAKVKVTIEAK